MGMVIILDMRPRPLVKLAFPLPMEALNEIWLRLAERFYRRSLKMVDKQKEGKMTTEEVHVLVYTININKVSSFESNGNTQRQSMDHIYKAHQLNIMKKNMLTNNLYMYLDFRILFNV